MEQATRNKLRNVVTQCRKLLEESIAQQLQGQFGVYAEKNGVHIEDESRMSHLSVEDKQYRRGLLDHLAHIQSASDVSKHSQLATDEGQLTTEQLLNCSSNRSTFRIGPRKILGN